MVVLFCTRVAIGEGGSEMIHMISYIHINATCANALQSSMLTFPSFVTIFYYYFFVNLITITVTMYIGVQVDTDPCVLRG